MFLVPHQLVVVYLVWSQFHTRYLWPNKGLQTGWEVASHQPNAGSFLSFTQLLTSFLGV